MNEEIYIIDYIDQINKLIEIYNYINSLINKINNFNYHTPNNWNEDDIFGIVSYLKFNMIADISDIINKHFDELCNDLVIVKLKEVKNRYKECIDLLGSNIIYINTNKRVDLSTICLHIDFAIENKNKFNTVLDSREYIKYTDDDIAIIKNCILKIVDELSNFKNNLKLDKKDYNYKRRKLK